MVLLKMVLFVDMQTDLAVEKKAVKRSSGELTNNSVSIFLFYSYRIGRKEMFYLTYVLNTFYLQLYGKGPFR